VLGVSVGNSDVMVLSVSSGVVSLDYGGLSAGLSVNLEPNPLPLASEQRSWRAIPFNSKKKLSCPLSLMNRKAPLTRSGRQGCGEL
jgi:hypothetical protein